MKGLYTENFKSQKKEIEEDILKWKDLICSWIGRTNIVKKNTQKSHLLKAICRFNAIPINIPMRALHRNKHTKILKFINNHKRPQRTKSIMSKKAMLEGLS